MTIRHTCNATLLSRDGVIVPIELDKREIVRRFTKEMGPDGIPLPEGDGTGGTYKNNADYKFCDDAAPTCTPTPEITDPNFTTGCGGGNWVCNGVEVNISAGEAVFIEAISSTTLDSTVALNPTINTRTIKIIVSVYGSGSLHVSAGGDFNAEITGVGTFEYEFVPSGTDPVVLTPDAVGFAGTLTEVSLSECVP